MSSSVRIRADHFAALDGTEPHPDDRADRVLDEVNRAVSKKGIDSTGVAASRAAYENPSTAVLPTPLMPGQVHCNPWAAWLSQKQPATAGPVGLASADAAGGDTGNGVHAIDAKYIVKHSVGSKSRHVGPPPASSAHMVPRISSFAPEEAPRRIACCSFRQSLRQL